MELWAVAVTVLCLDQWSKRAVRLSGRGRRRVSFGPLLRIRVVSTTRPSFARRDRRVRLGVWRRRVPTQVLESARERAAESGAFTLHHGISLFIMVAAFTGLSVLWPS